ncbi:MAG: hypothetical protein SVS85_03610 [Candidatus Nanohaloarchaea archaeon]|nr:hypothetical protein [Candidatus Nanohaloarchaea archaeon]
MVDLTSFQRRLFTAAILVIGFFFTVSGGSVFMAWMQRGSQLNQTALAGMALLGIGFFLLAVVGALIFRED